MGRRVWTTQRKWMGNLVPALICLPLIVAGVIWIWLTPDVWGPGLAVMAAAPVVGWLATNLFGLYDNARMRRDLARDLAAERPGEANEKYFVGFASPKFASALDAHQDVGYLILHRDRLEFFGEEQRVTLPRGRVKQIRFRPNVHTLLGLGRWVSVEGDMGGKPVRMLVEPREADTLLRNRHISRNLKKRLEEWART